MRTRFHTGAVVLTAAFVFVMGQGIVGTLIPAEAASAAFPKLVIGMIGSGYYCGFCVGCLTGPALVSRAGHRSTFRLGAILAGTAAAAFPLWITPTAWCALRMLIGFAAAILYTLIESWLNDLSTNTVRGRVCGAYVIIKQGGSLSSQTLLATLGDKTLHMFYLGAILYTLAFVPVVSAHSVEPLHPVRPRIRPQWLWRRATIGVLVCTATGLANGAIWSLAPVFAVEHGFAHGQVGQLMGIFILGGILAQIPIAWLSDRLGRRKVIFGVSSIACVAGLLTAAYGDTSRPLLLTFIALYGSGVLPLYALGVAEANDHATREHVVETAATLLILNAVASIAGPLLASAWMENFGSAALFGYTALVHATVAACAATLLRPVERRRLRSPGARAI